MDRLTPEIKNKTTRRLTLAVVIAFLIATAIAGVLTYTLVRDLVISWELTSLPGIAIVEPTPTKEGAVVVNDPQTPLQPPSGPTPEAWDGASRVTMLVMGLDYRDWEAGEGAPRTDTMMLLTIDPLSRTAGILSIPRDLWVNVPGFEYGRINTAYSLGEAYEVPGGGPGLAMATVEGLLGVPIDYYAQIDFSAFIRFIDEIGGVRIDVPERIVVDPLGDNNTKTLKPGRQTLPGDLALAYARARKTEGGDFDRAQRQQQVILAIRDRMVNWDILPVLISKAPQLYQEISAGVHTNLSLEQAIQLAWLAQQIPEESIQRGVIAPPEQVLLVTTVEGDQVLKPIADKIREERDKVFFGSEPVSPLAGSQSPLDLAKAEAPRLTVLNGSSSAGLAARTSDYLQSQGLTVGEAGNAEQLYTNTTVFDYTGKPYTIKFLMELMNIQPTRLFSRYDPTSQVDVVVIVGTDWAASNPMP